jgi:glycosyltransferase involved in cell wall biosynthesis
MEILHFCPLPLFAGLEQYALLMARLQKERGRDVGFVVLKGSILEREVPKAGIPIFVVETERAPQPFSIAAQYKAILAQHPELKVIHLHSSQDIDRLGLASLMLRVSGQPLRAKVIQQNHIWISHSKRDPIHWLTHRVLDEIWCSSEPARRDIVKYVPFPAERVHVIKYGRDVAAIEASFLSREAARAELGLPAVGSGATVLGAIARIDRGKGIWELLNGALKVMKEQIDRGALTEPDLHLCVIGGPTLSDPKAIAFSEQVNGLVAGLPPELASRVHMKGNVPDAARFLKAFDLYAQVAYKETFSLALLDAQLAGLPVLGTNSGGTPEVVREGKTGWLCEPEDTDSLAASLTRALNGRAHWQAFGTTAQERVRREFVMKTVMDEILAGYER